MHVIVRHGLFPPRQSSVSPCSVLPTLLSMALRLRSCGGSRAKPRTSGQCPIRLGRSVIHDRRWGLGGTANSVPRYRGISAKTLGSFCPIAGAIRLIPFMGINFLVLDCLSSVAGRP
jgi:hypothetical protein